MRRAVVMSVLVLGLLVPLAAGGQDTSPPPPGPTQDRGEAPTPATIAREFDRLELQEARRALRIDDEAFEPIGQRIQRIQALRRRQLNQRRLLLAELRAAVSSGSVDTNADGTAARLVELGNLGVRHAQELRRAHLALDGLLSLRQRAEYRLFQERFERRKLDLLARARQARGRPPLVPR